MKYRLIEGKHHYYKDGKRHTIKAGEVAEFSAVTVKALNAGSTPRLEPVVQEAQGVTGVVEGQQPEPITYDDASGEDSEDDTGDELAINLSSYPFKQALTFLSSLDSVEQVQAAIESERQAKKSRAAVINAAKARLEELGAE